MQIPLTKSEIKQGIIPLRAIFQLNQDYNNTVDKVSFASARISKLVYSDLLTGLPNRARLREFTEWMVDNNYDNLSGVLIFIDLDDFKQINDGYDHAIGDQFLQEVALKLKKTVVWQLKNLPLATSPKEAPVIARFGEDEFAIIFPGLFNTDVVNSFLSQL